MTLPEFVIRGTIWLAMSCYAGAVVARWSLGRPRIARQLWTAGLVVFLAHVWAVFHFVHEYSHANAFAYTARRTAEVVGVEFGGGLFVNYAFTLLWSFDAAWWWAAMRSYENRPRWVDALTQAFFLFIIFNSTVVFGVGPVRWFGAALTALVMSVFAYGAARKIPRLRRANS